MGVSHTPCDITEFTEFTGDARVSFVIMFQFLDFCVRNIAVTLL